MYKIYLKEEIKYEVKNIYKTHFAVQINVCLLNDVLITIPGVIQSI